MNTKLTIDLREGTLEVEGSEDFVREVYQDFKAQMHRPVVIGSTDLPIKGKATPLLENESAPPPSSKRGGHKKSEPGEKAAYSKYKPTFNGKLNLAGLEKFYDDWQPSSNTEKILVFLIFLRDKLGMSSCSADDIYTCFFTLRSRTKIPEAFEQAFIHAKGRTHFIEYKTIQNIEVTIAGDNHFNDKLSKKGAAK